MSELVTVFTVPDEWTEYSSIRDHFTYETVVGTVNAKGEEFWIPRDPKSYFYNGGYSEGYSLADVLTSEIELSEYMARRFTGFLKKLLVGKNWVDVGFSAEKYDCHWFAQWLNGEIKSNVSTMETLNAAEEIVSKGQISERIVRVGEIGVLGCISPKYQEHFPEHSFVGLEGDKALQVMGLHGTVAISSQAETAQHYMETSDGLNEAAGQYFGVYVLRTNERVAPEVRTNAPVLA